MADQKTNKIEAEVIWASRWAELNKATVADITLQPMNIDGKTKIQVMLSMAAPDGWAKVQWMFAKNLPTDEDLKRIQGLKFVDMFIMRGWNNDTNDWGKMKAVKFVTSDGEEIVLQGDRDRYEDPADKGE